MRELKITTRFELFTEYVNALTICAERVGEGFVPFTLEEFAYKACDYDFLIANIDWLVKQFELEHQGYVFYDWAA